MTINADLEWVESFAQDMYNPTHFKIAFCKVLKPEGNGVFTPIDFLPYKYQNAWTDDESKKRVVVKSRQVGFSVNESLDTMHTSLANAGYKKLFTSLKQEQATKNLTVITECVNLMEEEFRFKFKRNSDKMLEFPNGSKIYALPSSDDAGRSFSGDIFLDEFAFVAKDKELLKGISSVAVRAGYRISMGSTPYGQRGEFHRIIKECGWDTSKLWLDDSPSTKREFYKAYKEVLDNNESNWSFHVIPWWVCPDTTWEDIMEATETESDREQEFGLGFMDETTSMYSFDVLLSRSNSPKNIFNHKRKYTKPKGWRRIGGLDPAEKINKTAFVVFDQSPNGEKWYKRFQQTWDEVPLTTYVGEVNWYYRNWKLDHLYIDGTGMGVGVHGMFQQKGYTESMMTKVKFTNPLKADMVHNGLSLYEAEPQRIFTDMNKEYNKQFHQVRKEVNRFGKPTYTGKIDGKDDDVFWASQLCLLENIDWEDDDIYFEVIDNSKSMRANKYVR